MKNNFKVFFVFLAVLIVPALCQASTTILARTSPTHTIASGSDEKVYGTSASNQITLEVGARAELINFPGQNSIQIQSSSDLFTVSRSGTLVTFQGSDGTILLVPATHTVQTIAFADKTLTLGIYDNQVMLDDQFIDVTPAAIYISGVQTPTSTEVLEVLTKWHDQIEPTVSLEARQEIEACAEDYPLAAPDGTEPISVISAEADSTSKTEVNRRDWYYAARGADSTILGALGKGQSQMLDVGFWCFLEAALLQPEETEHLGNVAFHLNFHQAYQDALTILLYARSLNDTYTKVRNNLAYAYAKLGKYDSAIVEAQKVAALNPQESLYLERLAAYYEDGGYSYAAQAIKSALEGVSELPGLSPVYIPPELSSQGEQVRLQIEDLGDRMNELGQNLLDACEPDLYSLAEQFLMEWVLIIQETMWYCPFNVAAAGGDAYDICVNCYISGAEEAFAVASSFYSSVVGKIKVFENEALSSLADITSEGLDLVQSSGLSLTEREILTNEVYKNIVEEHTSNIMGPRNWISFKWGLIVDEYRAAMQEGCGEAPEGGNGTGWDKDFWCKLAPFACTSWTLNIFGYSMGFEPDPQDARIGIGNITFSMPVSSTIPVNYQVKWNNATGDISEGFSASYFLGKAVGVDTSATVMYTPTGVEGEVKAELTTNSPLKIGDGGVTIMEQKFIGFENSPAL